MARHFFKTERDNPKQHKDPAPYGAGSLLSQLRRVLMVNSQRELGQDDHIAADDTGVASGQLANLNSCRLGVSFEHLGSCRLYTSDAADD